MFQPGEVGRDRKSLADVLRELRIAAGLSGDRLAAKAHMSQAKISRVETGKVLPTVVDVERILLALEVPAEQSVELLRLARATNVDFVSRRQVRKIGAKYHQQGIADMIRQADMVRCLFPATPPGFLQTSTYMRSNIENPLSKFSFTQREELVAAKIDQRRLVEEGTTEFAIVFTESAVRFPMVDAESMADQIGRLLAASTLPWVDLALIPDGTPMRKSPLNTFIVFDQRSVMAETHAGSITLRDPTHVEEHLELFEYFSQHAAHGDDVRVLLRTIADDFRRRAFEETGEGD